MTGIHPEPSILISGAGPVGCTLALQLANYAAPVRTPVRLVLRGVFDTDTGQAPEPSPRTLALNQGSCALLSALGVDLQGMTGADILTVHVSQKGWLGRTLIEHRALQQPRLGRVVTYDALLKCLQTAVWSEARQGKLVVQDRDAQATLTQDEEPLLHVVADGQPPPQWQQPWRRGYGQHAVLAVVRASRPRPHWAFERFTREGPLALLPHPDGTNLYSLVWCCPPDAAHRRATCDAPAFEAALRTQFGERLGRLELTRCAPLPLHPPLPASLRLHVPLALHAGPQWSGGRRVVIGNAAQTLHPVAGQGLNLALRDVAQLAQALRPWLHQTGVAVEPLLQRYAQKRQWDRCLTLGVTDLLPRVFSTGNPLLEHACGLALTALDASRRLHRPLARHLLQGLRS